MTLPTSSRQFLARFTLVAIAAAGGLVASGSPSAASSPLTSSPLTAPRLGAPPLGDPPSIPGLPPVAPPRPATPQPLPRMTGTVPLDPDGTGRPDTAGPGATERGATEPGPTEPDGVEPDATALAVGDSVRLRALVLAVDDDDFGVPTWTSTLDRVGAAYDVLYTRTTPLDPATLVGADGIGRYNAILLTDSMLVYEQDGGFHTALNVEEWNRLWAYERDYGVRQAALYTSFGTWPENYCLAGAGEGGVGETALTAGLTAAGAEIFDYLKPGARLPIRHSYVYRTRITPGCAAEPVLTAGDDVLGVRTTSPDGRERLALTFTSNQYLLHTHLLAYGVFRWASRGLHLGEQRHFLNVDVDDWFNSADHYHPDGHVEVEPGYRVSGHDAYNLYLRQAALRAEHPSAAGFTFGLAYNGEDADVASAPACSPDGGIDTLTATSRCLADDFRWINHTATHPEVNFTDYGTTATEIGTNLIIGANLGLTVPGEVVKTAEYSGLGVYNDDPNDDVSPPEDRGLGASNPHLLAAARDLGVRYLHGNMSFASHVPSCFNCAIVHPMEPAVIVVPDWPTNFAYHTTTPPEQAAFYNSFYGPGGMFPYWPQNLTYEQVLDYEAELAVSRMAAGSVYTHTFHIANVRDYADGNTLVTDWVDRVLDKYDAYYRVPVLTPDWPALGAYAEARIGHFAQRDAGATAVYDRVAGTVTVTSPRAGTLTVSGVQTPRSQEYGTERSSPVTVAAGEPIAIPAVPRP